MIIGVIIQVTAIKGHKATAQFIIGRTITRVGNGIVYLTHALNLKVIQLAVSIEHINNPDLPSRMLPLHQPRFPNLHRRRRHRLRHHDRMYVHTSRGPLHLSKYLIILLPILDHSTLTWGLLDWVDYGASYSSDNFTWRKSYLASSLSLE
jgi:hypothetical protein